MVVSSSEKNLVDIRESLIVDEISPLPESCGNCTVANKQQRTAMQLQKLTEYVFDIASGKTTTTEVREILDLDQELAETFREWLHEFFPGVGAMGKDNIDNLRFVNDIRDSIIEWFIKHANRKIKSYEKLIEGCAGQGLRKIVLDRSEDKNPVELTLCNGALERVKSSKGVIREFQINTLAREIKSNNNPTT